MVWTVVRLVPDETRCWAVLSGITAVSSLLVLLLELALEPLGASTPMTVNGVPAMVTLWPTTSVDPKSSVAVVAPRTTTEAAEAWSALDKNTPLDKVRARTDNQEAAVPATVVVQLLLPATRDCELEVLGATAAMSGATTGEARAWADRKSVVRGKGVNL